MPEPLLFMRRPAGGVATWETAVSDLRYHRSRRRIGRDRLAATCSRLATRRHLVIAERIAPPSGWLIQPRIPSRAHGCNPVAWSALAKPPAIDRAFRVRLHSLPNAPRILKRERRLRACGATMGVDRTGNWHW